MSVIIIGTAVGSSIAIVAMLRFMCKSMCGQSSADEVQEQQLHGERTCTGSPDVMSTFSTDGVCARRKDSQGKKDAAAADDANSSGSKQETKTPIVITQPPSNAMHEQPSPDKPAPQDQHVQQVQAFCATHYGTAPGKSASTSTATPKPLGAAGLGAGSRHFPSIPAESVLTGTQMHSKYKIMRKLATTNTGTVFSGQDRATVEPVAIKVHHKRGSSALCVYNEAALHASLDHPNIVKLLAFADLKDDVFMVQEFLAGGELFDAVKPDIGCGPGYARLYMLQICKALQYLHEKGIAHRDIKPENIMLSGDKKSLKIIDFGLSERIRPPGAQYKRHVGTVPYMAAELWTSADPLGQKDHYAVLDLKALDVCVVFYCCVVGRFAWAEATSRSEEFKRYVAGDFTQGPWSRMEPVVLELLKNMLHLDPRQRWTMSQIVDYIENVWGPSSSPSKNKAVARASLRVDTATANKLSPAATYLAFSPQPEITSVAFDEVMQRLNEAADEQTVSVAFSPGA